MDADPRAEPPSGRPYDLRWGSAPQVQEQFGVAAAPLKAAWKRGWIRARQCGWLGDGRRTQAVYCFEDVHRWLEAVAHGVTEEYAKRFWSDAQVARLTAAMPLGPYAPSGRGKGA